MDLQELTGNFWHTNALQLPLLLTENNIVPDLSWKGIGLPISAFCQDHYSSSISNVSSAVLLLSSVQCHLKSCELNQCATTNISQLVLGAMSVLIPSEGTLVQTATVDECMGLAQY